jgi:transposase
VQDTKLFETILGIQAPWGISRVALDTSGERVDLWATHADDTRRPCPACQHVLPCRDHAEERVWRHLDTCQYQTFLHARVPRVDCPRTACGKCACPGPRRGAASRCSWNG